jgi:hypothetical protein
MHRVLVVPWSSAATYLATRRPYPAVLQRRAEASDESDDMAARLHAPAPRAALAIAALAAVAGSAAALPAFAADDEPPAAPLRYAIKVSKSGKGTRLDRLAISYPTAATLTTTCRRGETEGGPCTVDAAPVEGLACLPADGAPETTKCELRSTKAAPLWFPKGEVMYFSVTQPGFRSSALAVTFGKPGRYRITRPGS